MIADELLLRLDPVLARLEEDLRRRMTDPSIARAMRAEHARLHEAHATFDAFEAWTRRQAAELARAWVLSLVFVRTLEDRGLVPERLKGGAHRRAGFRELAPDLHDADYLLLVLQELASFPVLREVFGPEHNPVWGLTPSAVMAAELLAFAQGDDGLGGVDFSDDARCLGEVYERLGKGLRDRLGLRRTPSFVVSFVLARTLGPALSERGLADLRVLDPACGSGQFVLGAFERLRAAWAEAEPDAGPDRWAREAIQQVIGIDIHPVAVAITRFRLVLAYVDALELRDLADADVLSCQLEVADSLRPAEVPPAQSPEPEHADESGDTLADEAVDGEPVADQVVDGEAADAEASALAEPAADVAASLDEEASSDGDEVAAVPVPEALSEVVEEPPPPAWLSRRFDVVVGSLPQATVRDRQTRERYRERYVSAYRDYELVVPFVERCFGLADAGAWVGVLAGNGFTKRPFGQRLIEVFLPTVDLTAVVDASGVFLPGHETASLLLFGRQRSPSSAEVVTVLGKRGEPTVPDDPAKGQVWSSIVAHPDRVGFEDERICVAGIRRKELSIHPWLLRGGDALELRKHLERESNLRLADVVDAIRHGTLDEEEEVFVQPWGTLRRNGVSHRLAVTDGAGIRDWAVAAQTEVVGLDEAPDVLRFLWPYRRILQDRRVAGQALAERGLAWWQVQAEAPTETAPPSLAFAFEATHNHFVVDRKDRAFGPATRILELPPDATEDDRHALLAYLNSSTAGFWMKQALEPLDVTGAVSARQPEAWMETFQLAAEALEALPVPAEMEDLAPMGRRLDELASELASRGYDAAIDGARQSGGSLREALDTLADERARIRSAMFEVQEELDWKVYEMFGLHDGAAFLDPSREHGLQKGMRPSEILLARRAETSGSPTQWFERHGGHPVSDPKALPKPVRKVVVGRLALIEGSRLLRVIERPASKRAWPEPPVDTEERQALNAWLLRRIEEVLVERAAPCSVRELARHLHDDAMVLAVVEAVQGPSVELEATLAAWVLGNSVPYLAAYRYTKRGLDKYRAWQRTWAAQRREDEGDDVEVPVPPRYSATDFARPDTWALRGKLDLPRERFIDYPGAEVGGDPTPVVGWAGWGAAERMSALADLLEAHRGADKRIPLLAGMQELLPFVRQWQAADEGMADAWADRIRTAMDELDVAETDLETWRPVKPGRSSAPTITLEALLDAFDEIVAGDGADGVKRSVLAEALGVTGAAVGRLAQGLVDEGRWVIVKQRPIAYARARDLEPMAGEEAAAQPGA